MQPYSKSIKKLLHHWKCEAHERELHRELARLDKRYAAAPRAVLPRIGATSV